jgi:hypothetical protein
MSVELLACRPVVRETVCSVRWTAVMSAFVWEDIEAECIRTIERGEVDESFRLSRRHRWRLLAVDVHGDDAVVVVATRGKRSGGEIAARQYLRRGGLWVARGAGASGSDDRALPSRPGSNEGWFRVVSHGMSVDHKHKRFLRPRRVHDLVVQVAEGVTEVAWRGRRTAAAEHGFVAVVWRGRAMPTVELFGSGGERVGEIGRAATRGPLQAMPWSARVRFEVFRRFHKDEWFNYAPRRR